MPTTEWRNSPLVSPVISHLHPLFGGVVLASGLTVFAVSGSLMVTVAENAQNS